MLTSLSSLFEVDGVIDASFMYAKDKSKDSCPHAFSSTAKAIATRLLGTFAAKRCAAKWTFFEEHASNFPSHWWPFLRQPRHRSVSIPGETSVLKCFKHCLMVHLRYFGSFSLFSLTTVLTVGLDFSFLLLLPPFASSWVVDVQPPLPAPPPLSPLFGSVEIAFTFLEVLLVEWRLLFTAM